MATTNRSSYKGIKVNGGTWNADISESITSAEMSLSTSQVNQLTIACDDPDYSFINRHRIPMNTWVSYENLKFSVASLETNAGGGEGGFVITCRPRAIRKLKERKGKKTMKNVSPSGFVKEECRLAGIPCTVQPSARRKSVSRDVTEKGQQGSVEENNTWTTFNRLAEELGFICYELEGRIYFGQPTWFAQTAYVTRVEGYKTTRGYAVTQIPTCVRSQDNNNKVTISFTVPIERQADFRPGRIVDFHGVPGFTGKYFITSVTFDLAGGINEIDVDAETPSNPDVSD